MIDYPLMAYTNTKEFCFDLYLAN